MIGPYSEDRVFHIIFTEENRKAQIDEWRADMQVYSNFGDNQNDFLFRGFNPSSAYVNISNAEMIVNQMLSAAGQLARDNGKEGFFVPQQTDWHPLTNRDIEVRPQIKRFLKPENLIHLDSPYNITSGTTVSDVYWIPLEALQAAELLQELAS